MSDASKRALRTLFQTLLALLTVAPALLAALPDNTAVELAGVAAAVATVTAAVNKLEDAGLIPAWLKDRAEH